PRKILDKEIEDIKAVGVTIKVNSKVESLDGLFKQGYAAVFTGIGAYLSRDMGIPGEDDASILNGIDFLRNVNMGKKMDLGKKILVVGGGNAAVDSARTAARMGAEEVAIAYRRTFAAMPASPEEVKEAMEEGIKLDFLVTPVKVARSNGRLKVEFVRMELGNIDDSGRRQPVPIKGSEFYGEYDTLIKNIGDRPAVPGNYDLELGKGGEIKVDPDTLATSKKGVYAGGDVVSGPASVIEAIAAGRQAAISIDRYLGGSGDIEEKLASPEVITPFTQEEGERRRLPMCMLSNDKRKGFALVELGYDRAGAAEEAKRCLRCDLEER
ncbi:MAG: FAD-dependent oxidoreductase, partial [Dehalococcoidales bacterium]|nr:FAD-dependent oxidoreductase [Dehalococcoidales bacterium]